MRMLECETSASSYQRTSMPSNSERGPINITTQESPEYKAIPQTHVGVLVDIGFLNWAEAKYKNNEIFQAGIVRGDRVWVAIDRSLTDGTNKDGRLSMATLLKEYEETHGINQDSRIG